MPKAIAAAAPAFTADQLALIEERANILQWLKPALEREKEIRLQLAGALVPSPVEGTQRLVTEDGYEVILNHKINRTIDETTIDSVMMELPEESPYRVPGTLIKYKPELVMSGYKGLPADQLAIVQQAITEKPGTPELTILKKVEAEEAPVPTAAPEVAPSSGKAARGARKQTGAKSGTPTATKMIDKKAGKAKDGTIGNAINKAHAKGKK